MATGNSLRDREALFAKRIGRLLGFDLLAPARRVGIVNATITEPVGADPTLEVHLIMRITREEAIRLRYGDDVSIEFTERGTAIINIPDTPEAPRA